MLLVAACGGGGGGGGGGNDPPPTGAQNPPPAPGSGTDIVGATFDWSSHKRFAQGSDNWPMTWSADGNQYAMWGDGGGFEGSDNSNDPSYTSFGVSKITGDYNNYSGTNVYGGVDRQCESTLIGKSHGAPLSIKGGVLYTWVTSGSDGHAGFSSFTLYRSNDKACTWSELNTAFTSDVTPPLGDEKTDEVAYGGFVQFGKDYQNAIDNYVYVVAAKPTETDDLLYLHKPGQIMLLRVPRESIEDRVAYQFFAGLDANGNPTWSANAGSAKPIITEATGVGTFPQIIYVPEVKRFVYTNQYGDGTVVTDDETGDRYPAGNQALLSMSQAENVWGPYTEFYRKKFTDAIPADHTPTVPETLFQWNFAPKWFRNKTGNSLDFTMIFTGTGDNDSLNVIDGSFQLATK
jgi:hypothetical protein